jgi:hypothetical protein
MQRRHRIFNETRALGKEIKAVSCLAEAVGFLTLTFHPRQAIASKPKEILLNYHQETRKLDLFLDAGPTNAEVRRVAKLVLRDVPDFSHGLSNLNLEEHADELQYRATASLKASLKNR